MADGPEHRHLQLQRRCVQNQNPYACPSRHPAQQRLFASSLRAEFKIRTRVRDMRRKIMNSPNMLNLCLNQKISPNGENGCQNPKCHGRRLAASCCPEGIATRRVVILLMIRKTHRDILTERFIQQAGPPNPVFRIFNQNTTRHARDPLLSTEAGSMDPAVLRDRARAGQVQMSG